MHDYGPENDDNDDNAIQVGDLPDLVEPGALGLNANAAVVRLISYLDDDDDFDDDYDQNNDDDADQVRQEWESNSSCE